MPHDDVIEISGEAVLGMAFRLMCLQTNYRKPLDFTQEKLAQCEKTYRKWMSRIEADPLVPVPVEIIEALCQDLNTAKAVALMHGYSGRKEGARLFASMNFLGLIPGGKGEDLTTLEIKTIPPEQEISSRIGA